MFLPDPEPAEPIVRGRAGGGIDDRRGEALLMKPGKCADQRVADQVVGAAGVIERDVAAAPGQHDQNGRHGPIG